MSFKRILTAATLTLVAAFSTASNAQSYDFSTFASEGQSFEGATLGNMHFSSEAGDLHYTNGYGGGIYAGVGASSDVYLSFAAPISGISIRAGDGGGDPDAFGIKAYAFGTNALLGTWQTPVFGDTSANQWYTLSIGVANIGRIVFDPCNSGRCPGTLAGQLGVVITDINVTAVPEPEVYALMLAGLGLIGSMARRRKLKNTTA